MSSRVVERKRRSTQTPGIRLFKRRSRRSINRPRSTAKKFDWIPGLFQVRMTPSLQSILSCRIGINITNNERWVYIYKQKLLNELKERQSSNDKGFLKIKAELKAFPEDNILIGSYGGDEFLLCLSEYAKNVCENWKEEEKKLMMENLLKFLYRNTFKWPTLGSDNEIERTICNRSPLCTQLTLQTHLNIKFDLRLVKDAKDGYVELLSTRTTFNILFRKRLDKSSQVSGIKLNKYTQTIAPTSSHRSIQYNYIIPEVKKNKEFQMKLNELFTRHYTDICSLIRFNASINIYKSDYLDLPNQKTRYSIENPDLLTSFHDCVACHDKMVNCIAWNAHMSGVVAAAYGRLCPKFVAKVPPNYRDTHYIVNDTHLVLIWSVTQPVKPLLYLHAQREITAMNFCPFNPNILIGGCTDGQIVVWDIKGKIDNQNKESLQPVEVDVLIKEKMAWMKYPPDEQNIFPCIESKMETCHKSHVTVIKWLPPEYYLDNQGEFIKCKRSEEHMQFLTTAIGDSTMLVWDLKPKNKYLTSKKKKIKYRLSSRPKALDEKKSPFSKLNTNFMPMFQLNFFDSISKGPIHVNDFSFKMGSFSYIALNPETMDAALHRTVFIRNRSNENFTLEKNFLAATGFGQLYHCSWTSHDYDQGLEINRQNIDTIPCSSYHDGPIYHMQRSPFCADLVLTTGGRVFAIWDHIGENIKKPLIWRKAAMRYVMAVWSLQNSASIIAAREDGKIELWDFDEDSKFPLRMTKFIGDQLLSVFVNNSFHHVMKSTCITTDLSGILSIYSTPSKLFVINKKPRLRQTVQHIYNRRALLEYWNEYINKQKRQINEPVFDSATQDEATRRISRIMRCSTEIKRMSFEIKKDPANSWQEKEYKRMYKILIEKHRINLNDIEQHKGPLNKVLESRSARLRKIDRYVANKEKIFSEERNKITATYEISKRRRISVHFPKELTKVMKEQYYQSYKITEIEASKFIQSHQYRYFFDWQAMIIQAKKRYDGDAVSGSSEIPANEYNTQKYLNLIPPNVGRKSTKLLMTQIALVASISGK